MIRPTLQSIDIVVVTHQSAEFLTTCLASHHRLPVGKERRHVS